MDDITLEFKPSTLTLTFDVEDADTQNKRDERGYFREEVEVLVRSQDLQSEVTVTPRGVQIVAKNLDEAIVLHRILNPIATGCWEPAS